MLNKFRQSDICRYYIEFPGNARARVRAYVLSLRRGIHIPKNIYFTEETI
jgi:hypothetical protein